MKNGKTLLKSIAVLCLMLMLVWSAAGCANTAGFVSQTEDENDVAAAVEAPELEPNADDTQTTDDAQTTEDTQATDDAQAADNPEAADAEEISIKDIGSVMIGQTENAEAGTGCTVFISKEGMPAGLDVRGGGPASRESELLDPLAAASSIHAIVLSGGSAYGLGAADGVMKYLEEKNIGYDTGVAKVPLVAQSDLFDLSVGDGSVRPDAEMGYEAARIAMESPNYKDGNYGAGCGATVGKIAGMDTCMKTGIGSYAIRIGDLKIGAVVAVNALGDIYDWNTGKKIAGLLTEDGKGFRDTLTYMAMDTAVKDNKFTGNTTLGVVITNASFSKSQLCKIAGMAHDGYARSIRPVHTTADGDSIYAVSAGNVEADQDLVGSLSAMVMSEAINRAVYSADSAYGFKAAKDLKN